MRQTDGSPPTRDAIYNRAPRDHETPLTPPGLAPWESSSDTFKTWPGSGHTLTPGPPPHPSRLRTRRLSPSPRPELPTCLRHRSGSHRRRATARAVRGPAPGPGRRPCPGQRGTPARPAASPGRPPGPRRSAHLAGTWSWSSARGLGSHRPRDNGGEGLGASRGARVQAASERPAGAVAGPPALTAGAAGTLWGGERGRGGGGGGGWERGGWGPGGAVRGAGRMARQPGGPCAWPGHSGALVSLCSRAGTSSSGS